MLARIEHAIKRLRKDLNAKLLGKEHFLSIVENLQDENSKKEPLELFFYATTHKDACSLEVALKPYTSSTDISKSRNKLLIFAIAKNLDIYNNEFDNLIETLTEIAFVHNCEFDGWGMGIHLE